MDLSIIIPAKNEIFLQQTIDDIIKHKEGKTEIIVVLDGYWPEQGIPDHPDIKLLHLTKTVGQRAATNLGVSLSRAKYVMKLDAHCSFDQGFDKKMIEAIDGHEDWTMTPLMRNLWAFDWVCTEGHHRYQGPTDPCRTFICPDGHETVLTDRKSNKLEFKDLSQYKVKCTHQDGKESPMCDKQALICGKETSREMKWIGKNSPQSKSFCFDPEPHFQYFREYSKRPEGQGNIVETMSLQGSCFMVSRKRYLELDLCSEKFGSWGSQGIEVALKSWLSGGKVMCNANTWYAHMFRTQGRDFGFPYEIHRSAQDYAKHLAKKIFFNNRTDNFPQQKLPLTWLLEKFWPVPGWSDDHIRHLKGEKVATRGIVFFTDNKLKVKIAHKVQSNLRKISQKTGYPIVSASLKPMDNMGKNIVVDLPRGYLAYFTQILSALKASDADIIYMCEHDVLYHPSHFAFTPPTRDRFYYNQNFWRVRAADGFCAHWDANQVSGLVAYRELLIDWYQKRLDEIKQNGFKEHSFEPGKSGSLTIPWKSEQPNVDIRHGGNLTGEKWSMDDFRDKSSGKGFVTAWEIPGWGSFKGQFA